MSAHSTLFHAGRRAAGAAVAAALLATSAVALGATPASATSTLTVRSGGDNSGECAAATHTSIQAAISAAEPGDTVRLCAGTPFTEAVRIEKPLTLTSVANDGEGVAEIVQQAGYNKAIDIYNTSDVVLRNLRVTGSGATPAATGIDANSVNGLVLDHVTVDGFAKNGIAINGQWNADSTPTADVSFNDVTTTDNGWAGIAFYTRSTQGISQHIPGVTFSGTTSVGGNAKGIQFGDPEDEHGVLGLDGGPVALGVVTFTGNGTTLVANDDSAVTFSPATTVDGDPVVTGDLPGAAIVPAAAITVGENGYSTIASAVLGISPDGTITVPPGSYPEVVTIDKAGVTLTGAHDGVSAGVGAARSGDTSTHESVVVGGFRITSAGVTVDGFEIQSSSTVNGAWVTGANAVLQNNRFVGPGAETVGNYGVRNYSVVEVTDNLFLNNRRGINHDGTAGGEVSGNVFRGNALAIASGADDSDIRDNVVNIPDGGYQAIGLYGSGNTIANNTIVNDGAIVDGYGAIVVYGNTKRFADNDITGNTFSGAGPAISASENSFAADNNITMNAFLNTGVVVRNGDDDAALDVSNNWWGSLGDPDENVVVLTDGGDVVTSPSLSAQITSFTAPTTVSSATTSVTPTVVLDHDFGVTRTVTGADQLAFGVNTVGISTAITIGGVVVDSDTAVATVTRSKAQAAVTLGATSGTQVFAGTPATLTASVTVPDGGSDDGEVVFTLDGTDAATVVVIDGTATWTLPADLAVGARSITATFVPSTASALGATSTATTVTVLTGTSTVALRTDRSSQTHGSKTRAVLTATVAVDAGTTAGTVQFRVNGAVEGRVATANGSATWALPADTAVGSSKVTATFVPAAATIAGSTSAAVSVSVKKATSKVKLKTSRAKQKFGAKKRAKLTATVTLNNGVRANGKVVYRANGKKIGTIKLKKGKAVLKLAKKQPVGAYKVTATFVPASTTTVARSTSKKVTVKVTNRR